MFVVQREVSMRNAIVEFLIESLVALLQVMLFVGNLTEEWEDDATFKEQMSKYGTLVRCFVVRNWEGHSKVWLL